MRITFDVKGIAGALAFGREVLLKLHDDSDWMVVDLDINIGNGRHCKACGAWTFTTPCAVCGR